MSEAPTATPPDTDGDGAHSHTTYCRDHDDPTLDCSSPPTRTEGSGGAITSWLTSTAGIDYATVASVNFPRAALGDLIAQLQHLHRLMR